MAPTVHLLRTILPPGFEQQVPIAGAFQLSAQRERASVKLVHLRGAGFRSSKSWRIVRATTGHEWHLVPRSELSLLMAILYR